MKTFIILSMLLLAVSCGSGGGGSSAGGSSSTPAPDYNGFLAKWEYNFHLVVEGCNGATFTAIAYTDYGWPEENRNDWNGNITATGTTNIVVTGRELDWQVTSVSGGCPLTMKLYRQYQAGVPALMETKVIANNGESETIVYR